MQLATRRGDTQASEHNQAGRKDFLDLIPNGLLGRAVIHRQGPLPIRNQALKPTKDLMDDCRS